MRNRDNNCGHAVEVVCKSHCGLCVSCAGVEDDRFCPKEASR